MAKNSNQLKWIVGLAVIVFLIVMVRSSFQQTRYRYEVCIAFRGQSKCAVSDGATPNDAIRSARDIDCAQIAPGRDATMACNDTDPTSVRQLSGK